MYPRIQTYYPILLVDHPPSRLHQNVQISEKAKNVEATYEGVEQNDLWNIFSTKTTMEKGMEILQQ